MAAPGGQGGRVLETAGEQRRNGDDGEARADLARVARDDDAVAGLRDATHGRLRDHALAELRRDPQRHLLRACDEVVLLRAVLERRQVVEPAVRREVVQQAQERDLVGLGAEGHARGVAEQRPRVRSEREPAPPALGGLCVEFSRARCAPRRRSGHLLARALEPAQHELKVQEREQRQRGDGARVALAPAAEIDPLASGERGWRGAQVELARERAHPLVSEPDVLAAEIEDGLAHGAAQRPAAHAIARLEHRDGRAPGDEPTRRGEPGEPRADDDHVDLPHAGRTR